MDPISNSTPTPNPSPTSGPSPVPNPVSPVNPTQPINPSASAFEPAATAPSNAPVSPVRPTISAQPTAPVRPVAPVQSSGSFGQPAVMPTPQPVSSSNLSPAGFKPAGVGVAATEPIMMPEQPKAPDPIEEELKAPMKAAAPAPGSIGSAVSGPAESAVAQAPESNPAINPFQTSQAATKATTPSVSFSDPAMQPDATNPQPLSTKPAKKKTSKNTLIALIVVAVMVIIALGAVFAMQFMNWPGSGDNSGSGGSSSNSSSNSSSSNSSSNSNSNSNSSSSQNGSSSNSSSNGSNSGSSTNGGSTSSNASTVVCAGSYNSDTLGTVSRSVTFLIEDNKLSSATVEISTTDENGETKTEKKTMSSSEIFTDSTQSDETFEADGTLKVTLSEFVKKAQESLSSDTVTFTCLSK